MQKLLWLAFAAWATWAAPAAAQVPGCQPSPACFTLQTFTPIAVVTLPVTAVSAAVALPVAGPSQNLLLTNSGPAVVFVQLGNTAVVANTSRTPIGVGQSVTLVQGLFTNLAAVTAIGTATLTITSGTGTPLVVTAQAATGGNVTTVGNFPAVQTVNGTVAFATPPPTAWATPVAGTLGGISALVVATPGVKATLICNATTPGGGVLWLNLSGGSASVGTGLPVFPGGDCKQLGSLTATALNGISDGGTITFSVQAGN